MSRKLVIFGARQIAEVCAFYFDHDSNYAVSAFTVDRAFIGDTTLSGRPVVPFEEITVSHPASEYDMFVAIGYKRLNQVRAAKCAAVKDLGYRLATFVSTRSFSPPDLSIGENSFVMEASTVQPFVTIGSDTMIWAGTHIGHHSRIGNHCFLARPVVYGSVEIGDYCFVGGGSHVRVGVKVAPHCLIGARSIITADTQPGQTFVVPGTEASKVPSSRFRL